jgi:hypothetical protein
MFLSCSNYHNEDVRLLFLLFFLDECFIIYLLTLRLIAECVCSLNFSDIIVNFRSETVRR